MPTLRPVGHEDRLSLVEHLDELRTRIIVSIVAFVAAFSLCYWQNGHILSVVNRPLEHDVRYYWDTHMSASFMVDPLGLELIDRIGVDKVMWSSDYPHNESTYGYSEKSLAAVVNAVGPENATRIVSGNITEFLGL